MLQFTKREPEDTKSADSDRDVFNEKPSKEEVMAATQAEGPKRVSDSAIIHTSMGDIHIKLFPVEYVLTVFSVVLVLLLSSVPCDCSIQDLPHARYNCFLSLFLPSLFPDSFLIHQGRNVILNPPKVK